MAATDGRDAMSPSSTIRMLRHAHPYTRLHPTFTGQHSITTYTSGSNSGGAREGMGGVRASSLNQQRKSLFICHGKNPVIFLKGGLRFCNALE
jgi:hypothetical protein